MRTGNKRQGLQFLGPFRFRYRFVKTFDCDEIRAVPLVRRSVRRLESNSFLKLTLSRTAIPVPAKFNKRHRRVRLSRTLVDFERACRSFLRFRKTLFRLQATVNYEHVVAVSQSGIRIAVVRIDRDRLVEKLDRLLQRVAGAFVPGVAAFEVEPVSLELFLLFDIQLQTQVLEDVARDVVLHEED